LTNLENFKNQWINDGMRWKPPFKNPIHITDIAYSLCVYRENNYQIELYICKPNTQSPVHSHPGVESISMYLTGNLEFSKNDNNFIDLSQYQKERENGTHYLIGVAAETNNGDDQHALRIGKEGGAFLVFEYWKEKEPTSVTVNWLGELVGELHQKTIGDNHVENC